MGAPDQLAAALRASEARFRVLAEAAPDAIVVLVRGVIVYMNPAGGALLAGAEPAGLIGRAMADFLPAEQVRMMAERLRRVASGERLDPIAYSATRPDGRTAYVEISSSLIEWDGRPAILALGRDVSERRRLQEELIRADRMAALGALAAGVAHEIANPLSYTLLHLQRLRRQLPDLVADDERRAAVTRILDEAMQGGDRVRTIVRDLLEFGHADSDTAEPVDVRAVLEAALRLVAANLRDPIRIARAYVDVPAVVASGRRLEQVFVNLLINACQAFGDQPPEDACITVTIGRSGESGVYVEVADNGPGIPASQRDRVFEPFFTTKPSGVGTGLGLPISRAIVEAAGGRMEVADHEGGGVAVRVHLPALQPVAHPAAAADAGARPRVLVVDDEPMVARAVESLLSDDYEVCVAGGGPEALARLLADDFAVVFCDINMPAMNGFELYDRARAGRPEYAARFVFITGGALAGMAPEQTAAHAHRIIAKPFGAEALFDAARRILSG
ncbi:MAG TPA: ATP-binding protein [Kofleriaceae bacterium]|nr:ATP-binding protein [Kofleriaceae bacterium]